MEAIIKSKLEKVNIKSLDAFKARMYKHHIDSGCTKVEALSIIINDVEGDCTQLSNELSQIINN